MKTTKFKKKILNAVLRIYFIKTHFVEFTVSPLAMLRTGFVVRFSDYYKHPRLNSTLPDYMQPSNPL